jgi:hypothetical protein
MRRIGFEGKTAAVCAWTTPPLVTAAIHTHARNLVLLM